MQFKKTIFIAFLLFNTLFLSAQPAKTVYFLPVFEDKIIQNDSIYYFKNNKNDSIKFENIKFYITNIHFLYQNKIVFTEKNKKNNGVHLINNAIKNTKKIGFKIGKKTKFDTIQFDLGIDSITNISGAYGGDLDPTTGMYWAWQSGYINAKIEGKTNLCPTRKNEFQFHLGGYLGSNNALQTVVLPIQNTNEMNIFINIDKFIQQTNLQTTNQIMSTSKEAVLLAKKLVSCFNINK